MIMVCPTTVADPNPDLQEHFLDFEFAHLLDKRLDE